MDQTLVRHSYSIEKPLSDAFERIVRKHGYTNRSEFIRDMIREKLVEKEWREDRMVVGTITLVYSHRKRALSDRLTRHQHEHFHAVLAATHVHLDHDLCAEAIVVRDRAGRIRELADTLRREKGVLHTSINLATTGRHIS